MILLALHMDAGRNEALYASEESTRVDSFLGSQNWRESWAAAKRKGYGFRRFLADMFVERMISLHYLPESGKTMVQVKTTDKNLPLYHLGFFSRNHLGYKFWKDVQRYASMEPELPF